MEAQRERARAASKFGIDYNAASLGIDGKTEFTGYDQVDGHEKRIRAVIVNGEQKTAEAGDEAVVV